MMTMLHIHLLACLPLLLSLVHAALHKSDFLVENLEEVVPAYAGFEGEMYAGTLPMDNSGNNNKNPGGYDRQGSLMFWLFAPDKPIVSDSMVIWLNGGPGCSSFSAGVMMETAPVMVQPRPAGYCCLKENEPLVYNKYAWTNATAMLYIEQPVNVGFSHGGPDPIDEDDVSGDVYAFLVNFYKVFTEFQPKRLFIVGESYAGMYAPSIARRIYLETSRFRKGDTENRVDMNLAGVALGNGWADASVQGSAPIDYAYWHGMIDQHTREALHAEWEHCMYGPKNEPEPKPFHKFNIPDDCAMMEGVLMAAGAGAWPGNPSGPNTYDVTTWDSYSFILGGNHSAASFYNNPLVKKKLHAPMDIHWQGCIPGAGRRRQRERRLLEESESPPDASLLSRSTTRNTARNLALLEQDRPKSTVPYLAELLDDADARVLIYNGDRDLSTCAQGSEMLLNAMVWSGADHWKPAPRGLWTVNDKTPQQQVGGYAKEHKGLSFVVVYNSGHLAPFNVPVSALDLITRFLKNESFKDYPLPSFSLKRTATTSTTTTPTSDSSSNTASPTMPARNGVKVCFVALFFFAMGYAVSAFVRNRKGYEVISDGCELEKSNAAPKN